MLLNTDHFVIKKQDTKQNKMLYIFLRLKGNAIGYMAPYVAKKYKKINFKD